MHQTWSNTCTKYYTLIEHINNMSYHLSIALNPSILFYVSTLFWHVSHGNLAKICIIMMEVSHVCCLQFRVPRLVHCVVADW